MGVLEWSFEGKIFKEQQTKIFTRIVLPNLARMLSAMQQTTKQHAGGSKSLDKGPPRE